MPTTYVPITDPEQAERLYEAGLLWEHNIVTMVGHPPVPTGACTSNWKSSLRNWE